MNSQSQGNVEESMEGCTLLMLARQRGGLMYHSMYQKGNERRCVLNHNDIKCVYYKEKDY